MKKVLKWVRRGVFVVVAGVLGTFAYGAYQAKRTVEAVESGAADNL